MDDSLEAPSSEPRKVPSAEILVADDEQLSDEEEGGLDWTKLLPASSRPVIPKRGEKEYEPRAAGGTNLQLHILDQSRNAMFETLKTKRSTSSKAISYGVWHPTLARTEVTVARGIHFANMGYSALRPVAGSRSSTKSQKRLELLPEEAVYLIERGTLFCWKEMDLDPSKLPGLEVYGSPMSVQQAYTEMLGTEGMTLEKFQVFSYLKRLGYVVTRATPPDASYPTPSPRTLTSFTESVAQRVIRLFTKCLATVTRTLAGSFNWWQPVGISRWLHHDKNYGSLFHSLRFIPVGHKVPLHPTKTTNTMANTTYQIFYNIYKPATPFKKTAPPPPDFQLVVVNARTTPMPTLHELTALFDILPETPPPGPRRRPQPLQQSSHNQNNGVNNLPTHQANSTLTPLNPSPSSSIHATDSFLERFFPWLTGPSTIAHLTLSKNIQKPNPFVALKTGKKIIIIAAVDMGNISFFRFGQGEFSEWPMV